MPKEIKHFAEYQRHWPSLVPPLRPHKILDSTTRSISGEAPKDFVMEQWRKSRGRRHEWVGYIAKVGNKHYPVESITEHLVTRIGQLCGLKMAVSKLRIVDGQLRFLSRYFLRNNSESLVHGAEIFEPLLSKQMVQEIADKRAEKDFYTFQMVEEAVNNSFPENKIEIMKGFVRLVAFDALIGNQDRHFFNWAIIVSVKTGYTPRFSPIYDTARALFWDMKEQRVKQMLHEPSRLEGYVNRSRPSIGWDRRDRIKHFDLLRLIWEDYPQYRVCIRNFMVKSNIKQCRLMVDREFRFLMSGERRELIKRCLSLRYQKLCTAVSQC